MSTVLLDLCFLSGIEVIWDNKHHQIRLEWSYGDVMIFVLWYQSEDENWVHCQWYFHTPEVKRLPRCTSAESLFGTLLLLVYWFLCCLRISTLIDIVDDSLFPSAMYGLAVVYRLYNKYVISVSAKTLPTYIYLFHHLMFSAWGDWLIPNNQGSSRGIWQLSGESSILNMEMSSI